MQYGVKTAFYHTLQLLALVPLGIKSSLSVNLFKSKIKHWKWHIVINEIIQISRKVLDFVKST